MKIYLPLLVFWGLAMSSLIAQPTFTGQAATDFSTCGCVLTVDYTDPVGDNGDVCISPGPPVPQTGFDVQNVYMHYDQATDRLYIGMDMVGIAGDADGDGDPQTNTNCAAVDCNGCGKPIQAQEAIGINFDFDEDGNWDYYIGWPLGSTAFGLYSYDIPSTSSVPRLNALSATTAVSASAFATPPSAAQPDPEFIIDAYSTIDPDIAMNFSIFTDTPGGGEDIGGLNNVTLPVVLRDFQGDFANDQITLNWQTERELNNLGFEVEMADEQGNFQSLGFVPGAGTSESVQQYQFQVNQFNQGINLFRLKQKDLDGHFAFSDIVAVEVTSSYFFLFPNPSQHELFVRQRGYVNSTYQILQLDGRILSQGSLQEPLETILLTDIPAGMYLLQVSSPSGTLYRRFVKK